MTDTDSDSPAWLDLLTQQRWAALATIDDDSRPYVSSVAFASSSHGLLLHLSELAAHTKYLLSRPAASILIAEPDLGNPDQDPQTLPRLSISGEVTALKRESTEFQEAAKIYIARFPESEMRFGFGDFHLLSLLPIHANFVGGFGRASKIPGEKIVQHLRQI